MCEVLRYCIKPLHPVGSSHGALALSSDTFYPCPFMHVYYKLCFHLHVFFMVFLYTHLHILVLHLPGLHGVCKQHAQDVIVTAGRLDLSQCNTLFIELCK